MPRTAILVIWLSSAVAPAGAVGPLDAVNDWLYVLQPGPGARLADMAATDFDLVVTDYSRDGTEAGEHSPGEVEALRASGKVVLAYLSLGEAEEGRFYWDEDWTDQGAGDPDAPSWLGPKNPDFPDNYKVRYWDAGWQAILLGGEGAYLDRILAQGFDGVYLDIIDAYYYWSEEDPELSRDDARREMIALVERIAAYGRENGPSGFLVVPQNGADVVLDDEDRLDGRGKGYLAAIDAVGMEDLFFDELALQDAEDTAYRTAVLEHYKNASVAVLSVDYVWNERSPFGAANVERYNAYWKKAFARGYVPYAAVSDRDLDEIVEVAAGAGFEGPQPRPDPASPACETDGETLCLTDGRFAVRVAWRDFRGRIGTGHRVEAPSVDSGLFYFFDPDNWEMLVKVLDACRTNGRFWVFAAATTNVEYTLTVTDTATGASRSYKNELGTSSPAVTDTAAFATCGQSSHP